MPRRLPPLADPVSKHVGARIKLHRMRKGYTPARLGLAIGVSDRTVHRYEAGTLPLPLLRLGRICAELEISPEVLFHSAPLRFEKSVPVDVGTMANPDTRRLLSSWDRITGNARKRLLGIAGSLARAADTERDNRKLRHAVGLPVEVPRDDAP